MSISPDFKKGVCRRDAKGGTSHAAPHVKFWLVILPLASFDAAGLHTLIFEKNDSVALWVRNEGAEAAFTVAHCHRGKAPLAVRESST